MLRYFKTEYWVDYNCPLLPGFLVFFVLSWKEPDRSVWRGTGHSQLRLTLCFLGSSHLQRDCAPVRFKLQCVNVRNQGKLSRWVQAWEPVLLHTQAMFSRFTRSRLLFRALSSCLCPSSLVFRIWKGRYVVYHYIHVGHILQQRLYWLYSRFYFHLPDFLVSLN